MPFDIDAFNIEVETEIIGSNFFYFDEIESTNSYAMEEEEELPNGTVILAEKQNNGRGRHNRKWYSLPEQNLTFSIVLKDKFVKTYPPLIGFVASLCIAQTIENLYQLKVNLKWPNDVLINNKKIAGILLESKFEANKIKKIVVGIGLNVNQKVFQGTYIIPPTSIILELKAKDFINREKTLAEFLNLFEEKLLLMLKNPDDILNDWKLRCNLIGEKITLENDDIELVGIFEDIDKDGSLILRTKDKIEKISYGELSIR
jgi:BirA family biotin operon repressor/biotin-[acetyl-CoA-carboxylase] ligase